MGLRLHPSKAQEEECFIFTEAFLSAGSLISPLHIFGNPAVGWIYGAERRPLGAGQGTPDPRFLQADGARSPLTFCLAEASPGYATRLVSGSQDSRPGANHSWGPPFGSQTRTSLRHCSSVPFRSSLPSTHLASPTRLCS